MKAWLVGKLRGVHERNVSVHNSDREAYFTPLSLTFHLPVLHPYNRKSS